MVLSEKRGYSTICLIGVIFALTAPLAELAAQTSGGIVSVVRNGDPAHHINILVLGDAYTPVELQKYSEDVQRYVLPVFDQEPFREYQRFFNVYRIDLPSNESGATHLERTPPIIRDTSLSCSYNDCGDGSGRCLDLDEAKLRNILDQVPRVYRDIVIVLVNDEQYGGSALTFSDAYVSIIGATPYGVESVLHELGHSIGGLADEYEYTNPCEAVVEPYEANATKQTERSLIKWHLWIDGNTVLPTTNRIRGLPGLYRGARYCTSELYRPTYESKMRSLGAPFDQVNSEQLIRRFYARVDPIEVTSPPVGSMVSITKGESTHFEIFTPALMTGQLYIYWSLDREMVGIGSQFTLNSSSLALGSHSVKVSVLDRTEMVRVFSSEMSASREWNVYVTPTPALPMLYIQTMAGCGPAMTCGGPQGTTFNFQGNGFTAGKEVRRFITDSQGFESELMPVISADTSGNLSWSYSSSCLAPVGTFSICAIDSNGTKSNAVTEIVTQDSDFCGVWPTYQHDSRHSGQSPDIGPRSSDSRLVYDLGRTGGSLNVTTGTVVGPNGLIYFVIEYPDRSWKVVAVNTNGQIAIETPTYQAFAADSTPTVAADGSIYVAVRTSNINTPHDLYCFYPDGRFKWKRSMESFSESVTLGSDGTVYVASGFWQNVSGNYLYAFNPPDGSDKWPPSSLGSVQYGNPLALAPNGNLIFTGSPTGSSVMVNAYSSTNGSFQWSVGYPRISSGGPISAPAIAPDGSIYFWASPRLWRVTPDGQQVSSTPSLVAAPAYGSTPAIGADGSVRVAVHGWDAQIPGRLYAFNSDLTPKWNQPVDLGGFGQDPQVAVDSEGWTYVSDSRWRGGDQMPVPLIFGVDNNGVLKWSSSALLTQAIVLAGSGKAYTAMLDLDGVYPSYTYKIYSFEPVLIGRLNWLKMFLPTWGF